LAQVFRRSVEFPPPLTIKDLRRPIVPLGEVMRKVGRPVFDASGNQFTPTVGKAGTEVTLRGRNLNLGGLEVSFGATVAEIISDPTDTEVVVKVPIVPIIDPPPIGGFDPPPLPTPVRIKVETSFGTDVSDDIFTVMP
jgi:hypothetical protein